MAKGKIKESKEAVERITEAFKKLEGNTILDSPNNIISTGEDDKLTESKEPNVEESLIRDAVDEVAKIISQNPYAHNIDIQIQISRDGGEPKLNITHLVKARIL